VAGSHYGNEEVRHIGQITVGLSNAIALGCHRQTKIMMRIASEFGLTPASRSRISIPTEPELGRSLGDNPQGNL